MDKSNRRTETTYGQKLPWLPEMSINYLFFNDFIAGFGMETKIPITL